MKICHQDYELALYEALYEATGTRCQNTRQAIELKQSLQLCKSNYIFQKIGDILNVPATKAKDFYHNTFKLKIYDSISTHMSQIKKIVLKNMNLEPSKLCDLVVSQFPNTTFYKHRLLQTIHVIKREQNKRNENSVNSSSSSQLAKSLSSTQESNQMMESQILQLLQSLIQ